MDVDPYAPPRAESEPRERKRRSKFEGERRSVFVLLILCVVTIGIYPTIWFIRRQKFIDSLGSLADHQRLSPLPWVNAGLTAFVILLGAAEGAGLVRDFGNAPSVSVGVLSIVIAFRVRTILRSHFAQTGRFITISGPATFFFGVLYLQHILNKAADDPGVRKKKRKRA